MMDRRERKLVVRAQRGSRDAANALFEAHWERAWKLALALTSSRPAAEDVVQEAFERAFRGLGRFDGRSGFGTWLHRIVVNTASNAHRRDGRIVLVRPPGDAAPGPDAAIADAVSRLPDERRVAVVLRYWLELTPSEIAELLDVPVGTVHSRLARALDQLRTAMEELDVA